MSNSRRQAAFVIARWLLTKEFAQNLLPDGPDRAFVQDLVYTTIRRLRPLRKVLGALLKKWPKGELEALLYVGAAQILYMPSVPDFAAVNETVDAAKGTNNPSIAKVVNGVLRNLLRRREEFQKLIESLPPEEFYSFPTALYRRWEREYGGMFARGIAIAFDESADTYLAYPDRFEKLPRGKRVSEVPGYETGEFIVQDPATAISIDLLDCHEGETILDACAAPGGKTIQMAWRKARVTACEVNPKRRQRLEENLRRVHLNVEIATSIDRLVGEHRTFDKILVDAPCSNTGVMGRRVDARWNWSEDKLASLVRLQGEILDQVVPLLKKGGLLVYSTCSIEHEECHEQVRAFLRRHSDFSLVFEKQSLPCHTGHDGAYAASLKYGIIHGQTQGV